jgi:hypothetical protein
MAINKDLINPKTIDPVFGENVVQNAKTFANMQGVDYNYKPPEYSQGNIALSAIERENTLASSIIEGAYQVKVDDAPDPDFDVVDYIDVDIRNSDYAPYWKDFVEVKNYKQAEALKAKIDRQNKNQQIIEESGASGIAWSLAAGIFDPINLLPIGGGAYKAYKAGKFIKGIGLTAGAGAVGMTASEGILQATQETRTLEESVINIGAGTILAGALGGASAMLSKRQFNKLAKKLEADIQNETSDFQINPDTQKFEIKPDSASAASVAEFESLRKYYDDVLTPQLKAEGKEIPSFKDFKKQQQSLETTLTQDIAKAIKGEKILKKINAIDKLNPIQRLTQTKFATAPKEIAEKLMKTGLMFQKNKLGIASAQSAEISKKQLQATYFNKYKPAENEAWYNFKKRVKKEGAKNTTEQNIKDATQFYEELSRSLRNGDVSDIPEIQELAKNGRNEVLNKLGQEAVDVGLLNERVLKSKPKTAESYFPRLFNKLKVIARENDLRGLLTDTIKTRLLPNIKKAEAQKELNLNSQILDLQTQKIEIETKLNAVVEEKFKEAQINLQTDEISDKVDKNNIRLYRGLKNEFDPKFDITKSDAPSGYSTWTDNPELARQYAGANGFVYQIDLPKKELGQDIMDNDGERYLFFDNKKPAGLNNVSGKEFLVYNDHDLYDFRKIKEFKQNIKKPQLDAKKIYDFTAFGEYKNDIQKMVANFSVDENLDKFLDEVNSIIPEDFNVDFKEIENLYNQVVKGNNNIFTQDELSNLLNKYKQARKTINTLKPKSLLVFLRDRGGVIDYGGDLKSMGFTNKTLPGLIRKPYNQGKLFGEKKQEWIDLDYAREAAFEEGYFAEFPRDRSNGQPDINDLLRLMEKELRGEKIFSIDDIEKVENLENANRIIDELELLGIDFDKVQEAVNLEKGKIKRKFKYLTKDGEKDLDKKTYTKLEKVLAKNEINLLDKKINRLKDKYIENQVEFRSKFEEIGDEDQYISEIVDDIVNTLKGEDRLGLIDDLGIKVGKRGPLKERTLNFLQDNELEPWLENDASKVLNYYQNTLSTDIAIARAFDGDLTLDDAITKINDEYKEAKKGITDEKQLIAIEKERKAVINDINSTLKIMRGMYARPDNPDSTIVRGGRVARQFNYATKMGMVAFASITDLANPIAKHGLATWGKTLPNLIFNLKGVKLLVKEAKFAGNITDVVMPERMASFSGLSDPFASNTSAFERVLENINKSMSKLNLMPLWNDFQKSFSSIITQYRMINLINNYENLKQKDIQYLAYLGIGRDNYRTILKELKTHAYKEGNLWVANTEKWQNPEAVRLYRNALNIDVDSTIVTVGAGDLPLWAQTEAGKVVAQFKSFVFGATQQVLVANLQRKDLAALSGLISAVGLGMFSYYLRKQMSGKEVSNDPIVWINEGLDRSGYLGILAEYYHIADKVGLGFATMTGAGELSRYQTRSFASSLLGPTIGTINDLAIGTSALVSGERTPADAKAIRRMMPLNNTLILNNAMDNFEKSIVNK